MRASVAVLVAVLGWTFPAFAHHSPAAFNISQTVVVDGTVAKLEWRNPHCYLVIGVPSGAAKHLVERLVLTADRRHIDYSFTLEDPEYLVEPVSFSSVWEHHPELSMSSDDEPCDPEIAARFLEDW